MVLRSGKLRSSGCVKEKGHGKGVCLDLILGPLHGVQQLDAGPYSGLVLCAQKKGGLGEDIGAKTRDAQSRDRSIRQWRTFGVVLIGSELNSINMKVGWGVESFVSKGVV